MALIRRRTWVSVCLALCAVASPAAASPYLFWTDVSAGTVGRSHVDGSDRRTLATGPTGDAGISGVAADPARGHVYWIDDQANVVRRVNFDGSGPAVAVPSVGAETLGVGTYLGLAVNPVAGHVYWAQANEGDIRRANLDGSNPVLIADRTDQLPDSIAVDSAGGKVYWTELAGAVRRANLDGSNPETILTYPGGVGSGPSGVALDPQAGKLYVSLPNANRIDRLNLDGTGREVALTFPGGRPFGLAIDTEADMIYWADLTSIRRSDLNGTSIETVVTGLQGTRAVAIAVPEPAAALLALAGVSVLVLGRGQGN